MSVPWDPGPFPWAELFDGGTTAPSGVWMPVPFNDGASQKGNDPSNEIFDFFTTDLGDVGNPRDEVRCKAAGIYLLDCVIFWDQVTSPGANDHGYAVMSLRPHSSDDNGIIDQSLRASADWPKNETIGDHEMVDNGFLRVSAIFFATGNNRFRPQAKQTTGSNRGLSAVYFRLLYLGPKAASTLVPVPPSSQPGYADADAEGIAIAFDSDTHATPAWTRVDA